MMDRSRALIGFAFLIAFSACDREDVGLHCHTSNTVTHRVGAGEHDFSPRCLAILKKNSITFRARLRSSTAYRETDLQTGLNHINKLYGFSDCGKGHLQESARFGWTMINGQMRIVSFVHRNGKMVFNVDKPLAVIDLDQWYTYRLSAHGSSYQFMIESAGAPLRNVDGTAQISPVRTEFVARGCQGDGNRYRLGPYFGGRSPAPHGMQIEIQNLSGV